MTDNSHSGRPDSMDRAQTLTLHAKGADSSSHPEAEDTNASTLDSPSLPSPAPAPNMSSHSRSKTVDVVRQGKRLSLQFPIQRAAGNTSPSFSPRSRPQSLYNGTAPLLSPDHEQAPSEINLLAVLAAQERYVLELKEELQKAEADLGMLKNHWTKTEADKQRNLVRKVAALQPLDTTLANVPAAHFEDDGSGVWLQKEMERRKNILSSTKTSQRKVFSGSRHLRQLSLLSPDRTDAPSLSQPLNFTDEDFANQRPYLPARASTSSDLTRQVSLSSDPERHDLGGLPTIQREQLIRAGTQMATDFKKGLFTFIEDIRQATVGDEAGHAADAASGMASVKGNAVKASRKSSDGRPALSRSASSKKATQQSGSFGDDFWKEMGLAEPKPTATVKKAQALKTATPQKQIRKVASEEDWDNWDTPSDSLLIDTKDSSDESDAHTSPVSGQASSRTSTSTAYHSKRHDSKASSLTSIGQDDITSRDPKRNSIPWPDLNKMSPSNLKRTASHFMKEWEKQLTPPPQSQDYSHGDYMN